jgi:chemotaxis protein methyltransferase CheR
LSEALTWSEQWINADKVEPSAHYLHATVLQELGHRDSARRALQRCLFLRPDFALAHFALGNLERSDSRHAEAARHFENAQRLLSARPADELLAESDGLTVQHLTSIITTLLAAPDA